MGRMRSEVGGGGGWMEGAQKRVKSKSISGVNVRGKQGGKKAVITETCKVGGRVNIGEVAAPAACWLLPAACCPCCRGVLVEVEPHTFHSFLCGFLTRHNYPYKLQPPPSIYYHFSLLLLYIDIQIYRYAYIYSTHMVQLSTSKYLQLLSLQQRLAALPASLLSTFGIQWVPFSLFNASRRNPHNHFGYLVFISILLQK